MKTLQIYKISNNRLCRAPAGKFLARDCPALVVARRRVARHWGTSLSGYGGVSARWNLAGALLVDSPAIVSAFEVLIALARNDQSFKFVDDCST